VDRVALKEDQQLHNSRPLLTLAVHTAAAAVERKIKALGVGKRVAWELCELFGQELQV
jgi:hypothetical protein